MENQFWFQVILATTPETEDAICNFLFEIGSVGIVEQDHFIHSYFPSTVNRQILGKQLLHYIQALQEMGYTTARSDITISEFEDKDWNVEWKELYHYLFVTG